MKSWADTLIRNHGMPPTKSLSETIPIEYVQNKLFCNLLHDDLKKFASNWESYPLSPTLGNLLPDEPGLYMFVWRPDTLSFQTDRIPLQIYKILYVGKASRSIQERFCGEYRDIFESASPEYFWSGNNSEGRKERLIRLLSLTSLEFWFCRIDPQYISMIDNLETRLIQIINPPANFQKKLKPVGEPQPIWRSV